MFRIVLGQLTMTPEPGPAPVLSAANWSTKSTRTDVFRICQCPFQDLFGGHKPRGNGEELPLLIQPIGVQWE